MIRQASVSMATAGNSAAVIIDDLAGATITVAPTSPAVAKCQYTTSSKRDIELGTAIWIDWPQGFVSTPKSDAMLYRVVALRLVTTGAAKLEVLGNAG